MPRDLIPSAVAVQSVYSNFAHVAGPALGGVLIAAIGLRGVYALDVATFAASISAAYLLPAISPTERWTRPGSERSWTVSVTSARGGYYSGSSSSTRTR
jgi:hypothetical protein